VTSLLYEWKISGGVENNQDTATTPLTLPLSLMERGINQNKKKGNHMAARFS